MVGIEVKKPIGHQIFYKLIAIASLGAGMLTGTVNAATPQTVPQVELNRYLGKWYEIAHLPMFFQRKCARNTTANYNLKPNGHIEVINQCETAEGKIKASTGDAYAIDKTNSKLKVSFLPKGLRWLPFTKGDYWVLKVDENYKTALVGGPTNKYLWILSRTPHIDKATYQAYLQAAQQQGYDTSKLIITPQPNLK